MSLPEVIDLVVCLADLLSGYSVSLCCLIEGLGLIIVAEEHRSGRPFLEGAFVSLLVEESLWDRPVGGVVL